VLLGGRAAEMLIFGRPSTGAADDLAKATDMARAIVMRYGMHETLGPVAYEDEPRNFLPVAPAPAGGRRYSDETAREIDCAVREAVQRAFEHATRILTSGRKVLERGAQLLLEKETLGQPELDRLRNDIRAALAATERRMTLVEEVAS